MPRSLPSLPVLSLALRRRALRLIGRLGDPFADVPEGLSLSPSARHFADYEVAPLKLRFAGGNWTDANAWQQRARDKLAELSGYFRAEAPHTIIEQRFQLDDGLMRRRIYLGARPGVDIPVHLIERPGALKPLPVMICLQGTNTGAHLSWGEVRFPDDIEKKERGYDIAVQAAWRGYLAVAVEQSCFGERCSDVSTVVAWLIAEHDVMQADTARIHIMGHSSGGAVALAAAALDPRITAVLACGCLGFIRDSARRRDDSGQNTIPGILNWMEMADIVGLIAPRPFVTVAGEDDHIWPAKAGEAVVEAARQIYAALGAPDRIACVTEPGGHTFRPEPSWHAFEAMLAKTAR